MKKILPLRINSFDKKSNDSKHNLIDDECIENRDLYEDEDFLEILKMSSDDIKDEIRSYNEDPDEVLARIKGRLDNKIIPLKTKTKNKKTISHENIFNLLFNIVNKKISNDVLNKKQNNSNLFKTKLRNSYFKTIITTSIISVFSTVIVLDSNILYSSNSAENNSVQIVNKESQQNNIMKNIISKYLNNHTIENKERNTPYFSTLVGINPKEISQQKNERTHHEIAYTKNTNNLFFLKTHSNDKSTIGDNGLLRIISVKYNKNKNRLSNNRLIMLKDNDSIYSLKEEYDFKIKNSAAIKKLPSLISGKQIQITLKNNFLTKIGYINKEGMMSVFELKGENIKKLGDKNYYKKGYFILQTAITEGQNIYTLIRNSEKFKGGKNPIMANMIAAKIVRDIIKKNKPILFDQILTNSQVDFKVAVGINPKTNKISAVGAVERSNINLNVASK